jgi:glycyl-tRNA synthetase
MADVVTMDKIVSLCRRRGFVFPSSEIYGGLASSYDYGHYGVLLKDNVKSAWLRSMVQEREDILALDSSIILHPQVWEASGHVGGFSDPLVDCRTCKQRFRADHLADPEHEELRCGKRPSKRPGETPDCDLTEPRQFNLMFRTRIGAVEETGTDVYLRPETAQGIFINFKNVAQIARRKPPFGIAQIGKSFRNEITPGNFIFRTLEFEQMEMEYFVPPAEASDWYRYWVEERLAWHVRLGVRESHLRVRPHEPDELSHYSSETSDIEYLFPIGWSELEGIANRGDFDLRQHSESSATKLEWVDAATGERFVPHVIEPALGVNRSLLTFLIDAYDEEVVTERERTVLRLHPRLAPVKAAVLPLIGKSEDMVAKARALFAELRRVVSAEYDDSGAIGRRYRRQDEIGTPYALTVDEQTLADDTVTIRDRDSLAQERVPLTGARQLVLDRLAQDWRSPKRD